MASVSLSFASATWERTGHEVEADRNGPIGVKGSPLGRPEKENGGRDPTLSSEAEDSPSPSDSSAPEEAAMWGVSECPILQALIVLSLSGGATVRRERDGILKTRQEGAAVLRS